MSDPLYVGHLAGDGPVKALTVPPGFTSWPGKYQEFDVPTDLKQGNRATAIKLNSVRRPHMRAFHYAWLGFFCCFLTWFAVAPLLPRIQKDLHLTDKQVHNGDIASVAASVLARTLVGPICDIYGGRRVSASIMILGAFPAFFLGLVQTGAQLTLVRFFVGFIGATFVTVQFWSSSMFAKEVVGTANATIAGWGNLGGGVTQAFMIGVWVALRQGTDPETAWRVSFVIPAAITIVVAVLQWRHSDDCPKGNYVDLERKGSMRIKSASESIRLGYVDPTAWLLALQYACCFGVELTVYNQAASYFSHKFDLSTVAAGLTASAFGLLNIFGRSLGGLLSDYWAARAGGGVSGLRGRAWVQFCALLVEGGMLIVFSRMRTVGASIGVLVVFSLTVQIATGSTFGMVPYVCPSATGAVSGLVGAGGNLGAVLWSLIFRFGPSSRDSVFLIMGYIVCASSLLTPAIRVRGYDSMLCRARGEAAALDAV